eukprot:8606901-Alexandrium_andersonii.AAC.1
MLRSARNCSQRFAVLTHNCQGRRWPRARAPRRGGDRPPPRTPTTGASGASSLTGQGLPHPPEHPATGASDAPDVP